MALNGMGWWDFNSISLLFSLDREPDPMDWHPCYNDLERYNKLSLLEMSLASHIPHQLMHLGRKDEPITLKAKSKPLCSTSVQCDNSEDILIGLIYIIIL